VLTDDNRLITDFTARTDKPTPLNLALHGYWNLAGTTTPGNIRGHGLQVMADNYLAVDRAGIPTGEIVPVEGTAFDLRVPRNLDECLLLLTENSATTDGFDHCWAINGSGLRKAAVLYDPGSGRELTVETDRPGIQVYTANHFDQKAAHRFGEEFDRHCAVALETQSYPDSPNQPTFPDTILSPDEVWRSRTIYGFAVR
jgi:aldose 1-epimerase